VVATLTLSGVHVYANVPGSLFASPLTAIPGKIECCQVIDDDVIVYARNRTKVVELQRATGRERVLFSCAQAVDALDFQCGVLLARTRDWCHTYRLSHHKPGVTIKISCTGYSGVCDRCNSFIASCLSPDGTHVFLSTREYTQMYSVLTGYRNAIVLTMTPAKGIARFDDDTMAFLYPYHIKLADASTGSVKRVIDTLYREFVGIKSCGGASLLLQRYDGRLHLLQDAWRHSVRGAWVTACVL
jgi:hypothetical protein